MSETSGGKGYRLISNAGSEAHQTVAHFHIHLLAGRNLGPMLVSIK
ncbi:MAG: HIT domain-containing protein [Candidatus Pelagibacterales bacterium]